MANLQEFNKRLLQQVNDTKIDNLQLQAQIAQKDDELVALKAQLQTLEIQCTRNKGMEHSLQTKIQNNQKTIQALHRQLRAANNANGRREGFTTKSKQKFGGEDEDDEVVQPPNVKEEKLSRCQHSARVRKTVTLTPKQSQVPPTSKTPSSTLGTKTKASKPTAAKRQREEREQLEEELDCLGVRKGHSSSSSSSLPRKRARYTGEITPDLADSFIFKAVVKHHADGSVDQFFDSKTDLKDCLQDLWVHIHKTVEHWESKKGGYWQFEFEKADYKPVIQPCVTAKMTGARTRWRADGEGRFACKDCVAKDRPCFTWVADETAFELLPLHEKDRKYALEKGFEIRHWMNVE